MKLRPFFVRAVFASTVLLTNLSVIFGEVTSDESAFSLSPSMSRVLDIWLEARTEKLNIPGMAVVIVSGDNVVYSRGFGYADIRTKKKATPQTQFRIGSQSKLFTAVAIMQLCDEGKLRLDDTIDTDWARHKTPDGSEERPTIKQLLTHTSGLSSMTVSSKPFWSSLQFPNRTELEEDNTKNRSSAKFPPSEKLKYSNLGYTLLGQVVEAKTGVSYAEYIQQKILKPLEMVHTHVDTETRAADLARGYAPFREEWSEPVGHFDSGVMKSACGLVSTADDMGKFIAWQLSTLSGNRNEVLSSSTLREMQRPLRLTEDWSFGQGLGFQSVRRNETTMVGHGGQMPGAFSNTQIQVEKKLGISILTNGMLVPINPGDAGSIMDGLFEATSAVGSEATRGEARQNSGWESYYGRYRSIWGDLQVVDLDGQLVIFNPESATPFATKYTLEPITGTEHKFRASNSVDPYYLGETFSFERIEKGKAMVLRDPGANFERVEDP